MTNHDPPDTHFRYSTLELSACYDVHTKYFGRHQGCDNGSGTLCYTISGMPTCQWTILQHFHTLSAIS